ncbi:MAG: hypothetical protein LBE60_02915, partial [Microbacterium sp.]|uniref:hypothetical protein n=1 Tax=Microbacterium sp. TaxID=51671 RepID=UPI00282A6A51
MRTKTHPRYIDGHAYETPRTAFRHQLLLTFAALLILSGTSALIGIAHAMRRALALGTAPAPRADDFPSWTAWVLGAGSWWPALASAGLFVTVQLVATPHLRTAASSEESFRNRFSSAM